MPRETRPALCRASLATAVRRTRPGAVFVGNADVVELEEVVCLGASVKIHIYETWLSAWDTVKRVRIVPLVMLFMMTMLPIELHCMANQGSKPE